MRGESKIVGTLKLDGYGGQLMLRGDRLVAIVETGGVVYGRPIDGGPVATLAPIPYGYGKTELTEIDVSDPSAMKVSRRLTFDGSFAAARQNGGTVRVVLNSTPLAYTQTGTVDSARGWLPRSRFVSNVTGRRRTRSYVPCNRVSRTPVFSGLGMLSIVTLNLDKGLWQEDSDGVMTDAQTVYGSTKHLYVATQRWIDPQHAGGGPAVGHDDAHQPLRRERSGQHDLRGLGLGAGLPAQPVLDVRAGRRSARGVDHAADLVERRAAGAEPVARHGAARQGDEPGRPGRRARSRAAHLLRSLRRRRRYVVTFRQIDPLYVIDLSDPTKPRVQGELEIPGYSAYLHPVGAGRLLGIGQGNASLFDVSDPSAPKLLSQVPLGGGASQVEYDPHAFLYWAPKKLAFLPLNSDIVGLKVGNPLTEAGRIAHAGAQRSIVVGDRIYTVGYDGVMGSDLDSLAKLSFVAFPQQPIGGPVEPMPSSPPQAGSAAR